MRADELERVAGLVHRLAALTAGGVPLHAAWGYVGDDVDRATLEASESIAWRMCAAALHVAERAGAPVARVLGRLADALRDQAGCVRAVDVALAGPRATSRLVTALPLVGIVLGWLLGLDPIGAIVGTPVGAVAGVLGVLLMVAAWAWSKRIVTRAARGREAAGFELELVGIAVSGGLAPVAAREVVRDALAARSLPADDEAVDSVLALSTAAGVPARGLLEAEAAQARVRERLEGETRAAKAGIALVVPLGVCVLPAFTLLGVTPLVIAMLQQTIAPLG